MTYTLQNKILQKFTAFQVFRLRADNCWGRGPIRSSVTLSPRSLCGKQLEGDGIGLFTVQRTKIHSGAILLWLRNGTNVLTGGTRELKHTMKKLTYKNGEEVAHTQKYWRAQERRGGLGGVSGWRCQRPFPNYSRGKMNISSSLPLDEHKQAVPTSCASHTINLP